MHRILLKYFILLYIFSTVTNVIAQEIRVEDLKFKGNKAISSRKLKKAIQTQANPWTRFFLFWKRSKLFDEETFLNDLLRIEKLYHKEGYLEAIVSNYDLKYNKKHDEVNIVVYIQEGQPTTVGRVEFLDSNHSELSRITKDFHKKVKLKTGKRFREADLIADYNTIIDRFSNLGYPYIEAKVKTVLDPKSHTVVLNWYLDPGPYCVVGPITITGNKNVSDKVIKRGLGFKEGQQFQQRKLQNAQSQIYRLELFRFVGLSASNLDQRPKEIPIEVRVKETVLRTLKIGAGYGSEESVRATAQWRHRNFLGGARILRAQAKHSTKLLPLQLELELSQPYFLGNRNDLVVKPFFIWQDEKSFEAKRVGLETTFNRQLTRRTNFFVTTRVERDTIRVKGEGAPAELANLYNKSVLQAGLRRNSADQLFTPTKGSVSSLVLEQAGVPLNSRFKYIKLYGEFRKYLQIKTGYVFAYRIFLGTMNPVRGSRETPVEERYFSGGSYSVRGWRRQLLGPTIDGIPVGGNSVLEGSFELRNPIYKGLSGALFLDYGNVWQEWDGYDLLGLKYALGAGLRYRTPIGPFRFDFAWKLNKQEFDDKNYEIHISIGQAF
ncbi:MAG: outer membrane protein assembly factor BamA [bacterium]